MIRLMGESFIKHTICVTVIILVGVAAFVAGAYNPSIIRPSQNGTSGANSSNPDLSSPRISYPGIIRSQQASGVGTVTAFDNQTITLKDEKNVEGTFKLADQVYIYKPTNSSGLATPSTDKKSLQTGKQATISLSLIGDQYQVTDIAYIQ